jgi:hypothetical protein
MKNMVKRYLKTFIKSSSVSGIDFTLFVPIPARNRHRGDEKLSGGTCELPRLPGAIPNNPQPVPSPMTRRNRVTACAIVTNETRNRVPSPCNETRNRVPSPMTRNQ